MQGHGEQQVTHKCLHKIYFTLKIFLIVDYWKPNDVPLAEYSDSSDNSSSLVTNFSIEKMNTLEKDVDSTDTSEDEYIPLGKYNLQLIYLY